MINIIIGRVKGQNYLEAIVLHGKKRKNLLRFDDWRDLVFDRECDHNLGGSYCFPAGIRWHALDYLSFNHISHCLSPLVCVFGHCGYFPAELGAAFVSSKLVSRSFVIDGDVQLLQFSQKKQGLRFESLEVFFDLLIVLLVLQIQQELGMVLDAAASREAGRYR